MKATKVLTIVNVVGSAMAWLLFVVNQILKLMRWDQDELWEATGFLFVGVGTVALLISAILTVIACLLCVKRCTPPRRTKYLILNVLCPLITATMLYSCFFGNALTWG